MQIFPLENPSSYIEETGNGEGNDLMLVEHTIQERHKMFYLSS
jgi:hypothetical protein